MKFFWNNTTQIGFGENAVKDHLPKFVKPNSRILCTFGGGSIDKNGARKDVQEALDALKCEVRWEGGIPPNPEYDRLIEIVDIVKTWKPDLLLAVGGGSVLDGTKFIAVASMQPEGTDLWDTVCVKQNAKDVHWPLASVMTLPATGSEWNNGFVVSRRSQGWKVGCVGYTAYPEFSLLDPRYTMTLPVRQLRNGIFDAFCHCVDAFLTPLETPMFDDFWMSVCKELVTIGVPLLQPNSSLELHSRLIVAASFALNYILGLGQEQCWAIHQIGHMLTAKYDIDHGTSLAMCMPHFMETQFEQRKVKFAKMAEFVFGVKEGTVDEKARALIQKITQWRDDLGIPGIVSRWEGAKISPGDADELAKKAIQQSGHGQNLGFRGCCTEDVAREVLKKVIV
ncbi:alcohol dehydrogenase, iron-containing family protein [Tritrichomonas foetus]|uniref:Alcohol dehydrogenase, iron-containing family protein n=1 Tax=Tritrichomonas foetus TaxID=1144522 RepID=A0A1J4JPI7_9EUKA|nr:alcohol dehydrogenase, iron-containing family protein [Tritrichomonas foetus]|eukprot:OHT00658.1 alcohol dehydrogenase, iron-containing family protein [Tritrichomonas foetus]